MAKISTLHDGFIHALGDAYDAEQQFTTFMQECERQAQHPQLKQAIQQHMQQTQQQIQRLDQVFQSINAQPHKVQCKGATGIVNEGQEMLKSIKEKQLIDGAIVDALCKGEHYEIAAYSGLVMKAQLMGHQQAHQLLQQSHQEEQQTAQKLDQLAKQLGQEVIQQGPQLVGHQIPSGQMGMGSSASSQQQMGNQQ